MALTTQTRTATAEQPTQDFTRALAVLNVACAAWLAVGLLGGGFPLGTGPDPYAMRWGTAVLAVALGLAGTAGLLTSQALARRVLDDELALYLACQSLPTAMLVSWSVLV